MNLKTYLFITPTGGRTGSEMMLWYLLNHLKGKIKTAIFSKENGELFSQNSPADFTFFSNSKKDFLYKIYEGIYHRIFKKTPEITQLEEIQSKIKADYWYLNTLTMPTIAKLAKNLGIPYYVHVHELVSVYDEILYDEFKFQFENAYKIVCCSSIVKKRIEQMGYKNTILKHEIIDVEKIKTTQNQLELREKLKIPKDAYIWIMSGGMNMRKGYDMVPDLIENLPKKTYLIWLGSTKKTGVLHYLEQRVKQENLNFISLGAKSEGYYEYLNLADGFVLLAREDPFPLVMIEAAYLEKPIVGFNSGGISEFLKDGMGAIVDSFNPKDLANLMIEIQEGKIKIEKNILKNRALEFDVKNQIQFWDEVFGN